jgi:hypothetical protein
MDNDKMDLIEIEWGGMNWIHLGHNWGQWLAVANMIMNLHVP